MSTETTDWGGVYSDDFSIGYRLQVNTVYAENKQLLKVKWEQ